MRTLLVLGLAAATLSLTGCGGTFPIQQLPSMKSLRVSPRFTTR